MAGIENSKREVNALTHDETQFVSIDTALALDGSSDALEEALRGKHPAEALRLIPRARWLEFIDRNALGLLQRFAYEPILAAAWANIDARAATTELARRAFFRASCERLRTFGDPLPADETLSLFRAAPDSEAAERFGIEWTLSFENARSRAERDGSSLFAADAHRDDVYLFLADDGGRVIVHTGIRLAGALPIEIPSRLHRIRRIDPVANER